MKFILNCFCFFIPFIYNSAAQDSLKHCGTDEFMNEYYKNNPKALLLNQQLEQFTQQYQHSGNTRQQYIIPVVFHIIHNYGNENISDAQVKDAIRILNEDFSKTNADTSSIVNQFKPIAANCGIEFRLANIDPNGNCTNGIEHIASTTTYSGGEHSKLNPWPNESYLNIWVVRTIESGAAGYTYYPGNADPDKDGIIILSTYVGSIGTGNYQTARALTHEIGHWINLKHTWGGTNSPGVSCGDDNVFDTPQTKGWTSCNLSGTSCGTAIENVQNYMEYAYCSRMFTNGQKARMLAALSSSVSGRNNLWTNSNLIATGTDSPIQTTVCTPVSDFTASTKFVCTGQELTLTDKSWNATVLYRFWDVAGASSASSLTDSVITVSYNLPGMYSVSLIAGNNEGSDTKTQTALIQVLSDTAMYFNGYIENFETGTFPSNNFIPDYNSDFDWFIKTTVGYSGTRCLAFNNYEADPGRSYGLTGPTFNLSTIANPILTFHVAYAQKNSTNNDRLRVLVSENCGLTWTTRFMKIGPQLTTAPNHYSIFVPEISEWRMETVNLTPNMNSTNLRIKFDFLSDGGNNIYIDDINLGGYSFTENLLSENSLLIYPNPVTDELNLQFDLKQEVEASIKLYDLTGRRMNEIFSGKIKKETNLSYNISKLAAQVYIIQIESNGEKQNYRFVKM